MNQNFLPQSNISSDPEIYKVLKLGSFAESNSPHPGSESLDVPQNLPVASEIKKSEPSEPVEVKAEPKTENPTVSKIKKIVKDIAIYPLIFGVSFLIFYTSMNFTSLKAYAEGLFDNKTQDQELLGEDLAAYTKWINGYFYSVSDKSLLAATGDIDHDGLTNHDEYIIRTNPTVADSDGDGVSDGVEVLNSTNLWGAGQMTKTQYALRDKINVSMVSERISYNVSANQGKVVVNDANNFDLERNGTLSIPKLKLQVPLIWSKDPSKFEEDLQNGVIHYPGTSLPGEQGIMYVSGHSSDYIWKHDKYATVFTKINKLAAGDDVFVTIYGKDGKVYNYRYKVSTQKVYSPDDQTQFIDNSSAKLNLSTCWPIGTAKDRMVVTAELVNL